MTNANLKTREQISSTVNIEIWGKFKKLSEKMRVPQSRLLDEAITDLIKKYERKK